MRSIAAVRSPSAWVRPGLTSLDVGFCAIATADLLMALAAAPRITFLGVAGSSLGMFELVQIALVLPLLQQLDCTQCPFAPGALDYIRGAFACLLRVQKAFRGLWLTNGSYLPLRGELRKSAVTRAASNNMNHVNNSQRNQ
jgi:hypothetical protein